ncbi:zinc ribbon-containing (seleno)protein DG [Desulfolithobacter sp.]
MKLIIDPELKYCPQCHDEYRAEITTCASCNVELLTGEQMQAMQEQKNRKRSSRTMEIGPDDEIVPVRKASVIEIKQLQVRLEREGIPSLALQESAGSCGKGCCGTDLVLHVRSEDMQEVREFLARDYMESTGLSEHDTSHVDAVFNVGAEKATCPACGCNFPTTTTTCPDCGLCFG